LTERIGNHSANKSSGDAVAKVEAGDFDSRTFKRSIDKALTRKDDRELFGLPPT
jgi:hypothetical protein